MRLTVKELQLPTLPMGTYLIAGVPLAALLILTPPLTAQTVHPGKPVRVSAPSVLFGRLEGVYVGRLGDTLFFGNEERGPIRVPLSAITALDVSSGKSRWRGGVRGAMWGAGVAGVLGVITVIDTAWSAADGSKAGFILESAAAGVLIGGIVGAFVPPRIWRRADPSILVNAMPAIDEHRADIPSDSAPRRVVQTSGAAAGATPVIELTVGTSVPQLAYAQFPGLTAALAINRAWKPRVGAALVADIDASYLRFGVMGGPRVFGRSGPLFAGRRTVTYFSQVVAGTVIGGESGVVRSSGGFAWQPGVGIDYGSDVPAFRVQADYRVVPEGFVDDERVPGRHIDQLTGLRVVVGITLRFLPR